jgi:hypothetical protein
MSKFLKLKQAAKKSKPSVDVEDILEMALDGKLKLSVNFINPVYAKTGEVHKLPGQDEVIFYPNYSSLEKLTGVYDVAMIGNERLDIQNKLRRQNGEQEIDFDKSLLSNNGVLVVDENGHYWQLQRLAGNDDSEWLGYGVIENTNGTIHFPLNDNPENYEPRQYLPCDSLEFVVRETEIHKFKSISSPINSENLTISSMDDLEQPNQPRKKLKSLKRETNECLLLIYEMITHYNIQYLDQFSATKLWGWLISREFTSDLIKSIADNKKYIISHGGEKIEKSEFLKKYRSRFR